MNPQQDKTNQFLCVLIFEKEASVYNWTHWILMAAAAILKTSVYDSFLNAPQPPSQNKDHFLQLKFRPHAEKKSPYQNDKKNHNRVGVEIANVELKMTIKKVNRVHIHTLSGGTFR